MATAVARVMQELRDRGGLQGKDLANITDVSPATVSRWTSGQASPPIATQALLAELRYVVDRLQDIYTPEEARLWLNAKHAMLNFERPIDLIRSHRIVDVLAIIERLDAGVYL